VVILAATQVQKKAPNALKSFMTELESPQSGCTIVGLHIAGGAADIPATRKQGRPAKALQTTWKGLRRP
jgi:hypothetical protein